MSKGNGGQPRISEDKQTVKCQYPPCPVNIRIDKTVLDNPYKGKPPFCQKHLEMLNFYMWCVTAVKIQTQQTPGGIIVPGHKQFNPLK